MARDYWSGECICNFPSRCTGLGTLRCEDAGGCGGDACVCDCGGESECFGCEECARESDDCEQHGGAP